MTRWVAFAVGCLTAIGVGYAIFVQIGYGVNSQDAFSKLHLPLDRADYFQNAERMKIAQRKASVENSQAAQISEAAHTSVSANSVIASQSDNPELKWQIAQIDESQWASAEPHAQIELIEKIQSELKRAGCDNLARTGEWDNRTKAAIYNFVKNSNASLPIANPDIVLLSLIQNYNGNKCGLRCIGPACTQDKQTDFTQAMEAIAPPKLAEKVADGKAPLTSHARTIASGWKAEVTASSKVIKAPIAEKASSENNRTPVKKIAPAHAMDYKRIDTSTFGGTRMGLGVPSSDTISEPQAENTLGSIQFSSASQPSGDIVDATSQSVPETKKVQRFEPARKSSNWRTEIFNPDR